MKPGIKMLCCTKVSIMNSAFSTNVLYRNYSKERVCRFIDANAREYHRRLRQTFSLKLVQTLSSDLVQLLATNR